MAEHDESLVMRRPKRSTAGNRMEAALAEFRAEDIGQDVDEDVDFFIEKDEEDAFGSDFESTDEEDAQDDVDAVAEKIVREEEKRGKKAGRSQLDRVTAAAHARQKATFDPQLETSKTPAASKPKRRVSMGVVVDAETGEVLESNKRYSRRTHTMLSTSAHVKRMRDAEETKSALPKKIKTETRAPTQDELIARALDMEEGNVAEHRDYLSIEEEKRKRARLVRTTVEGPLLRWISKSQEVIVKEEPLPAVQMPPPTTAPSGYTYAPPRPSAPSTPSGPYNTGPYFPPTAPSYHPPPQTSTSYPLASVSQTPPPSQASNTFVYVLQPPQPAPPAPPPPQPIERREKVCKNFVVHELSQSEDAVKPPWKDTMAAMFGDHVKWEDLRVYTSKARPMARPTQICPITGQVARYLDPRSSVPFSSVRAYQTLTKILGHEYVWSDSLGCYTSGETSSPGSSDVPSEDAGRRRLRGRDA